MDVRITKLPANSILNFSRRSPRSGYINLLHMEKRGHFYTEFMRRNLVLRREYMEFGFFKYTIKLANEGNS